MPHLFGRLPRGFDPAIPHLSSLLAQYPHQPAPPDHADYWSMMPADWGMMGNDTYGDCTCAGLYHAMQLWSFHGRNQELTAPDEDVLTLYHHFNPPPEDNGCVEQDVLTYAQQVGAPIPQGPSRLIAFHEVDPRNFNDVKLAIDWTGCAYIGFNVPAWLASDALPVWDTGAGDVTTVGGHCVICPGYDSDGLDVISWGQHYRMTWRFWMAQVDECYALAHPWWVDGTGKTLLGMTKDQLVQQMASL